MQNNIKMQKTHPNSQCSCEWGQHWALYWGWDCYWDFSEQVKQTSFRNSTNKANPASRHWAALRTLETPFPGVLGICFPLPERSCCALQGEAERPQLLPSIPRCLCWEWQDGDREFHVGPSWFTALTQIFSCLLFLDAQLLYCTVKLMCKPMSASRQGW